MSVLALPALQLNKNWLPIRVITVAESVSMLFEGRAKAVDQDYSVYDFDAWSELRVQENEPYITTSRITFRIPDVIVLCAYGEIPQRKLPFSRANIYKRDNYSCQYCGKRPGTEELTIDHVVPKSRQGRTTWENCVLACVTCNRLKASKTLKEAGLELKRKPIKPTWSPRLVLSRVKNTPCSWEKFVNEAYWGVELKD